MKKTYHRKEIKVPYGMVKEMASKLGYSSATIRHALADHEGVVGTDTRRLIRNAAIKYYEGRVLCYTYVKEI